jgi:anaphase-promoting complex subunit 5
MELWYINSFDNLHTFFSDAQLYLRDPEKQEHTPGSVKHNKRRFISPTSILGCFVRRAGLEFSKLQFHETNSLWCAFVRFREPTLSLWKKRKIGAGSMSFDGNLKGMSMNDPLVQKVYGKLDGSKDCKFIRGVILQVLTTDLGTVSTDDVERLLEYQVETMQRR